MRESRTSGSERGKSRKGLTYLPNFISYRTKTLMRTRAQGRPLCHNRQCYKAQNCLIDYQYFDVILNKMADKEQFYEVIDGRN